MYSKVDLSSNDQVVCVLYLNYQIDPEAQKIRN